MVIAERACALAELAGAERAAGPQRLEELWMETVRVASHAQQWTFTKDWEWLTSRARYALREIREETESAVCELVGVGRRSDARRPLVLFNPLPYAREQIIEVPWVQPRQEMGGHRVWDADGNEVRVQLGEQAGRVGAGDVLEAPLIFEAEVPASEPEEDTVDNGRLKLRLSGRGLQEVTDLASGLRWQAPLGSCIGDCKLFEMGPGILHIGPITGEISARMGTGRWVLTGPTRWLYRWEGEFHGHRVRQDVILDDDCAHVDFVTRVFCAGANGFFALCFDLPMSGEMHVDIPFGVEPRDLRDEPYATDLPPSSIERHREHQFWARSWASVSDGEQGIALITADGDRYWTYDAASGELRHILFTPVDDAEEGWEAWVTKDRMALGWHEFHHRLLFHKGDWRTADLCGESDRLRLPLQVVKPLGLEREPLIGQGDRLTVMPTSVRISAFYRAPQGYVLRLYESAGEETRAAVQLPAAFAEAVRVDFNLAPVEASVELDDDSLTLPLKPWEIATVLLRRR